MPIPDGKFYMDGQLGAGMVATIEDAHPVNTETAGADINFGQGVVLKNGLAVPATKAPIYGIALKRTYIAGDHYTDLPNDHWYQGETIGVARAGTISVPVSEDVSRGDNATVDANGNFKIAGASDKVVGVFLSDGNKNGTANVQIDIALDAGVSSGSATVTNTPTSNTGSNSSSGSSSAGSNSSSSTSKSSK